MLYCMHVYVYTYSQYGLRINRLKLWRKELRSTALEEGTAKDSTVQEGTMKDSYARCIPQRAGLDYSDDLSGISIYVF